MKEYLSHLLPRLIGFSDLLHAKELFTEHPWVYIDENGNKQEYTFKSDGRLIMALDDDLRVGSWEYIPATGGLFIDRGTDKLLLLQGFIDRAVLLLRRDNFFDDFFILVNEKMVRDLDVARYLRSFLIAKSGRDSLPLDEGTTLEYESDFLAKGNLVYLNDKPATTGTYRSEDGVTTIGVEEGRVAELTYQKKYATRKGLITVTQSDEFKAAIGDVVMKLSTPAPDGVYDPIIPEQPKIQVKDGRIFKVGYGGKLSDWILVIILVSLFALIGVLKALHISPFYVVT